MAENRGRELPFSNQAKKSMIEREWPLVTVFGSRHPGQLSEGRGEIEVKAERQKWLQLVTDG